MTTRDAWAWTFRAVWAAALVVALWTFLDFGVTWDEDVQRVYAGTILRWFTTFGQDREALHFANLYLYGGLFEVPAEIVGRLAPWGVFEGRHLVNVLVGLAGVFGTYRLGAHLGGPRAGCLAGVFLLLTPAYYGASFNNPKDIPFAAAFVWATWAMLRAADQIPRIRWRSAIGTGALIGLVLGVRVAGVFVLGHLALLWGAATIAHAWQQDIRGTTLGDSGRVALTGFLAVVVAWAVMLVCWPYGQVKPFANPISAATAAVNFEGFNAPVLFNGRFVGSDEVPWTYLPGYFAVTLPEFYFLGLAAGLAAMVSFPILLWTGRLRVTTAATFWKAGFLCFALLFPVVTAIVMHSTLYDGLRQFLFVLPLLAVLSALGLTMFIDRLSWRWARGAVWTLTAASLLWVTSDMVALHPYQYVYYNRLVAGGVAGAADRFEADYWSSSYGEAVAWLVENYDPPTSEPIRVTNCSDQFMTRYYLDKQTSSPPRFVQDDTGSPHIFIATTRSNCHRRQGNARLLHVVERQGVGLAYVFEKETPRAR
jgi:hypothetical protein